MEYSELMQMISSVGFPIACCVFLFYYLQKQTETHKQEMDSLRESLDKNTLILTRLYERLGGGE